MMGAERKTRGGWSMYDPVVKRYRATCDACGFVAVRAEREAAEHRLALHINYDHDGKVGGKC